jgi:hypothetical protein
MDDLQIQAERLVDDLDGRRANIPHIQRRVGLSHRLDIRLRKLGPHDKKISIVRIACGGAEPVELLGFISRLLIAEYGKQDGIAVEQTEHRSVLVGDVVQMICSRDTVSRRHV